jgi:subtilisin family serine protease
MFLLIGENTDNKKIQFRGFMKKFLTFIATFTITFAGLTPAYANTEPVGAETGEYAGEEYEGSNVDIEVKEGSLASLRLTDMVIVSSGVEAHTVAQQYESFEKLFTSETYNVYYLTKSDAFTLRSMFTDVSIETMQTFEAETAVTVQNPTPSWGLDRIDSPTSLDNTYSYSASGRNVDIYVVDTGVLTTHQDFTGKIERGFTVYEDEFGFDGCHWHGTHVAGTAGGKTHGVAKNANIVPVRVLDCNNTGFTSNVIAGLDWIINTHDGGPAVVNLSLAGGLSIALNNAVLALTEAGFVVAAAAGNNAEDACGFSPASSPTAITVGGTDINNAFYTDSNFGSCVDINAPGVNIVSAYNTSNTATAIATGTSMAAPHVAGVAALLLEINPTATPVDIETQIKNFATPSVITGVPSGTVNSLLTYINSLNTELSFTVDGDVDGWVAENVLTPKTFNINVSSGFTNSASLSITGAPAGVTASVNGLTVIFNGTPAQHGSYNISFTLSEGGESLTVETPVIVAPPSPNINLSTSTVTITSHQMLRQNVSVSPNTAFTENAVITVSSGLPLGMVARVSGNNVFFVGKTARYGTFRVNITATEGEKSATQSFTVNVNLISTPNRPRVSFSETATNVTATIVPPSPGFKRPDRYTFTLTRNGTVVETRTIRISNTTSMVRYSSSAIASGSGDYVLRVAARNNAGSSAPLSSRVFSF